MRSTGSSQLNEGGQHVPAQEVTSSTMLLPWDHLAIALCDWKWEKPKLRWAYHGAKSTSQLKTFLGIVSIFYVSCANSTSNWPKLCLNMPTVGLWLWIRQVEKGLTPPKWVKWRPITPTTRNPVRLRGLQSNQYRHLEKFPKERKHESVCLSSPCLRTLVTSSALRWTTQAEDY